MHLFRSVLASNSVNSPSDGRELFRYFLEFTHAKRPFFSAAAWREIALRPHGLLTHSPFGLEEQLLISKIQLVGQKYRDNTTQSKTLKGLCHSGSPVRLILPITRPQSVWNLK